MAEAIVGPLVSKLQELALSEGKALVAVSGDIRRLRDKLMWLLAFLQEAEPSVRARGGELMRVFVHQIRDAAFSAEDAIDEYSVRVDLSRYPGWSRPALGFLAGVTTQLRVRHNLSGKIAAINARLEGIVSNKSTYCPVDPASVLPVKTWPASAASLSESILWDISTPGMIGREEQQSELENMLRNSTRLTVIYVVGESGVGRTKLVNSVCRTPTIREHFEVSASAVVKVQKNASVHNILRMICDVLKDQKTETDQGQGQDPLEQQVETNTQTNQGQEQAGAELKRRLDGKRYLVVIDGRKMSVAVWKAVIHALPKGETGSRVVMITNKVLPFPCHRDYEVEDIKLEGLSYDNCKEMFQKRLPTKEEVDREEFYNGVHSVTGGSPLAVVLLSGLMHDKEYPHEWDSVLEHLKSAKSKLLDRVLSLSYEDLHHELKLCFLYFTAFPESYTVDDDTLVKLWVAEGFLAPRNGKTAEQVGHTYVRQLIARGLVDRACRHHLALKERVYHFARSVAQEASFMELHDGDHVPEPATVRRLTLLNIIDRYVALHNCMPKLRSIIAIEEEKPVSTAWYQSCSCHPQLSPSSGPAAGRGSSGAGEDVSVLGSGWTGFFSSWTASGPVDGPANLTKLLQGSKFLRVIMLEGPGIGTELPEAIGSMVHLRYLGVRCQSLKTIPTSIRNLNNLQTMDVASSSVEELPESFWKIKSLRHVTGHQLRMPRRVGELKQLQTLSSARITVCRCFQNLKRMVNLRTLDMIFEGELKEKEANEFSDCLKTIKKLTHLKLEGSGLLMSIFTSPSLQNLQIMSLVGTVQQQQQLHTTPSSEHFQLPNLFRLSLKGAQLQKGFIERLGELPRLDHLIFEEVSIEEQELKFLPKGFRQALPISPCNSSAAVDALNTRSIVVTGSQHGIHFKGIGRTTNSCE